MKGLRVAAGLALMVLALFAATYFIREREQRRMDLEIAALSRPPSIEEHYSTWAQELPYKDPIVFTGDSLIYWANWTYLFRQFERDAPVIHNRGISGNTSADLLRRWKANILAMKPKIIYVAIGTNGLSFAGRMNGPKLQDFYLRIRQRALRGQLWHFPRRGFKPVRVFSRS